MSANNNPYNSDDRPNKANKKIEVKLFLIFAAVIAAMILIKVLFL